LSAAAELATADSWQPLDASDGRVPPELRPWLSEPGLLTARVRAHCGADVELRLLRVEPSELAPADARRLGVADRGCLVREIEFVKAGVRLVFARSLFPDSTVRRHPWLTGLGGNGLGERLASTTEVERGPLEYLELPIANELARGADPHGAAVAPLWARRRVYRLPGGPILVQEVFLPALTWGQCARG
jgi:chorismate--pyruvate lyase